MMHHGHTDALAAPVPDTTAPEDSNLSLLKDLPAPSGLASGAEDGMAAVHNSLLDAGP
jgi:hypothetical protein